MKKRQIEEIQTLNRIINDSCLKNWDGLNDGARWKYKSDKIKYIEWSSDINPEQLYFKINWGWEKGFVTGNESQLSYLNKLLKAKEKYDLMITTWKEDLYNWTITINELKEDWWIKESEILSKIMKDNFTDTNRFKNNIWFDMKNIIKTNLVEKPETLTIKNKLQ